MKNWKDKKVVCFKWIEYKGFIPEYTAIVLEETEEECLIKKGFKKKWTFKFEKKAEFIKAKMQEAGYCKLLT